MANRWWVGGTGTWDSSTTTHWSSASSGGAGGASVPGSGDTVIFDNLSGGGTVTLNFGGAITVQSITLSSFTGTFDNSINNNNINLSTSAGFTGSGSGVRVVKLGTATYTLSGAAVWNFGTTTNLTFTGSSSTIVFTSPSGGVTFNGGGLTYGTVTFGAVSGANRYSIGQANTFATMNVTAPNCILFPIATTTTISNSFTWTGSSGSEIFISSNTTGSTSTIAAAASSSVAWGAFRDMTFSGSPTATNSFDLGNNSGITITAPAAAGSGSTGVIGS